MQKPFNRAIFLFIVSSAISAAFIMAVDVSFCGYARAEVSLVDQQDSFYWYQEAKYQAVNRKDYEKAMNYCMKAVKLNPDNQHANALKAWLDERMTRLSDIKKMKENLSRKGEETTAEAETAAPGPPLPEVPDTMDNLNYFRGLTKLTEGKFDEADRFFRDDLVDNPDRLESWFYVFKYQKDNGNERQALLLLRKLREKLKKRGLSKVDPALMDTIKNQCQLYQDEAILQKGVYKHNLAIDVNNEIRGNNDWSAVSLIPPTSEVLVPSKIMTGLDIPKLKAKGWIPKNFSTDPSFFKVDINGRIVATRESFRRKPVIEIPALATDAARKMRDDVERLITQGDYYSYIGVYDRAESFYDEALERDPMSPLANNNKGVVLKVRGHYDAAIRYFKKAIACDKTYVEAYNNLATIYSDRENYEEALKLFLIALKLNPNEAGIRYNIGVMYHKLGKLDIAREYIGQAIQINSADPSYYYQLGQIDLKKGNRHEAFKNLRKVSNMVSKDSEIYSHVMEILRTIAPE